jgi:hypothetical protein
LGAARSRPLGRRSLDLNRAHQSLRFVLRVVTSRVSECWGTLITVPDSSPRASKGVLVLAWRLCRTFLRGDRPFSVILCFGGCARAHPPGVAPEAWEEWFDSRAGNEPSRAWLGSARPFHELGRQAWLDSKVAREPARLARHTLIYIIALSSELLVYKYKYIDIIHHYE